MDTYSTLRHFADSWGLLGLTILFVGIVLYTLRPGSKKVHDDLANLPLRNDKPRDQVMADAEGPKSRATSDTDKPKD